MAVIPDYAMPSFTWRATRSNAMRRSEASMRPSNSRDSVMAARYAASPTGFYGSSSLCSARAHCMTSHRSTVAHLSHEKEGPQGALGGKTLAPMSPGLLYLSVINEGTTLHQGMRLGGARDCGVSQGGAEAHAATSDTRGVSADEHISKRVPWARRSVARRCAPPDPWEDAV